MINKIKNHISFLENNLKKLMENVDQLNSSPEDMKEVYYAHDEVQNSLGYIKQIFNFTPDINGIIKATKLADAFVNWAEYTEKKLNDPKKNC